ncbi:sugar-binding domain-containing protein [Cellulomonas sp. Marseille-Q8402]
MEHQRATPERHPPVGRPRAAAPGSPPEARLDLSGRWAVALDRDGVGERELWFTGLEQSSTDVREVQLPGSLQEQGIGDRVGPDTQWTGLVVDTSFYTEDRYAPFRDPAGYAVPFWLQPHTYYRGAAWFQRTVVVPQAWAGSRLGLYLERVHWESTVWVDGVRIGSERSLSTPHEFAIGRLAPGEHTVVVRVDNRTVVDVGPNAHSISDHTQGNWNGLIGDLRLHVLPEVRIRQIRVEPVVADRVAHVAVDIESSAAGAGRGVVTAVVRSRSALDEVLGRASAAYDAEHGQDLALRGMTGGGAHVDLVVALGPQAATWDEFDPALHDLTVELTAHADNRDHRDTSRATFGLREVGTEGTQITVNGRRTFLRGTLESCVWPLTGFPPTDTEPWRRVFRTARRHGLNHLRFHSWCPPEAAFVAADEEGFYLQVEAPIWANQGAAVGEGRPVDRFLYEETERIQDTFGNHPSFLLMAHGNEPAGRDAEFLGTWVEHARRRDPRRLYTSGAGWPAIEESDYDDIPGPRTHGWGEGLASRLNARAPETGTDYRDWVGSTPRPIVSHEIGQWCAYPNFAETTKYSGLMQPKNLEVFAAFLAEAGMADQAQEFLHASGRLQLLCYKEEVEAALRTPGFGGFQLLGLNDFPGQGTALVGVLDAFWDEKPYATAAEFARFCGPVVPLARLPRRVWTTADTMTFEVQVANFGSRDLDAEVTWRIRASDGAVVRAGTSFEGQIPLGNAERHGAVRVDLGDLETQRLTLVVTVTSGEQTWENDWDVWVYAAAPALDRPDPVVETTDVDEALRRASSGATVLLTPPAHEVAGDVALGFTPVFWNTAWTKDQAPHTLGITHPSDHPLFQEFPSEGHTDWQWWELLHGAAPMVLDHLPAAVRPLVQPIDTWFRARRLGLLIEARVGRGRLAICTLNLSRGDHPRPEVDLFRHSLHRHLSDTPPEPLTELDAGQVQRLFRAR